MDKEKIEKLKKEIELDSCIMHDTIKSIVGEYAEELDNLVTYIEEVIRDIEQGHISGYTDEQLEYLNIKLPVLMYRAGSRLDEIGAMCDIAEAKKKQLQNALILRLKGSGTIAEVKAKVEQLTENEQIIEDSYFRLYNQLKAKLEYADKIFTAIKKVISKRMLELEVFRKDNPKGDEIELIDEWKEFKK